MRYNPTFFASWFGRNKTFVYLCPWQLLMTRGSGRVAPASAKPLTNRVSASIMYNYLPIPSNMRSLDHVLSMRIAEGSAGYGVYVMLLELLRDAEGRALVPNARNLAFGIGEPDVGLVERVLNDYGLFATLDDGRVQSKWLEQQMSEYDARKAAAVAAGKRGAAKRYGQLVAQSATSDTDPMGGAMDTLCPPHSNITQCNNTNVISPTKSKLLGMSWRDMAGAALFGLARKKEPLIDDMSRKVVQDRQQALTAKYGADKYNVEALLDVCDYFSVGVSMFAWLAKYTSNGRIGSPAMMRVLALRKQCQESKFVPKYPAEYMLVKLIEQEQQAAGAAGSAAPYAYEPGDE